MENLDIRQIWKSSQREEELKKRYSMDDIQKYRKQKSHQTSKSIKRSIHFDIAFKTIIMAELIYLIIFLNDQFSYKIIAGLLFLASGYLIFIEFKFIKRLSAIKETDSVIENIQNKLDYLNKTYKKFIFTSALSSPLFVLTCFFFYFHFKYNQIRMESPAEDPVLYLILVLAFALSLFSQKPVYRMQKKELRESIYDMDDLEIASVKIEESKKRRRNILILATLLILLGVLILLFMFIR